ncbi:MAG: GNAT family N-acetyltransferase [Anaerolineae bacterium]|nr:GNAT family N-acetyltransferase [Anaerolineae bacterium]
MVPEIAIRPIHPDDTAALHAILSHPLVTAQTHQLPTLALETVREQVANSDTQSPRFVAVVDGSTAGYSTLRRSRNPRRAHGGRLDLAVHPDYWRQGVGTTLLAAALDAAENWLNLIRVELDVFADNLPALALCERFGFEREGLQRCTVYGPGGWRDSIMLARVRVPSYDPPLRESPLPPIERVNAVGTVTIRPKRAEDAAHIYQTMTDHAVARTVSMPPFAETAQIVPHFASTAATQHVFVAEVDGVIVGNIGLHQKTDPRRAHVGGLGMSVAPAYWGHGIGTQLLATVVELADTWLNLKRIELEVNVDNPAAIRLYEKFDFEREGLKRLHIFGAGRIADSFVMARLR